MRRRLVIAAVLGILALPSSGMADPVVDLFSRPGCPHCEGARRFLAVEAQRRPGLVVRVHDVTNDPAALDRLRRISARAGVTIPGVPTFVIAGRVLVGFDPASTPGRVRGLLDEGSGAIEMDGLCTVDAHGCGPPRPRTIRLPWFGEVSSERLGLPLFTIAVGLVDGFNPCATWVLLFLLAMLANLRDRSRMALIAGTFVFVSGLVYLAFMAAWLTVFMAVGVSEPVRLVLAVFAIFVGTLNIKDFFAFGRGPSLSIPDSAKPGFYARVRAVLRAEDLTGALLGVMVIAFLVNLVELLCTAGLPAVYTAVLTSHDLPAWKYYGYLILYVTAYMLDDTILVAIGVITLSKRKLQEKGGRWLKLISGSVVLALGVALLLRPHWLGF
jgi:glutaredoxin